MAYLIDSDITIRYVSQQYNNSILVKLDNILDNEFNYSIISLMEVLGFNGDTNEMQQLETLFNNGNKFEINDAVVDETLHIRKITKIKLPDAIIAATSLVHDLELITGNVNDFKNVPGLKVIDPYTL